MFKNKKLINLYDIKQKYWGFDLMFNTSCTEPKLYEEFNNIITDNNFDITTLSKYKKLNKNSNNEEFNEFYNEWIKALRENNYVIHLDNNLNIDDFTIQVNNVLSKIGSTKFIDNNLVTNLYYEELQEYTINGKKIKEKINHDVLEANIVDKELKKIGYRLIYLFNGLDKYDKTIIPFSKFEKLNIIEKKIKKGSLNPKEGEKLIKDIENRFDVKLPQDYIDYMIENNGYVGIINEDYVDIWELESITLQNERYDSEEFYPGLVLFGSDGGGEAYAFDKNNNMNIVDVPFIGDENDIIVVSKSFNEFLEKLRNYSDKEIIEK